MIKVQCSQCGHRLSAPDHLAGRKAKCPHCQATVAIPSDPSGSSASPLIEALEASESSPGASAGGGRLAPAPAGRAKGAGPPMGLIVGAIVAGLALVAVVVIVILVGYLLVDAPEQITRQPSDATPTESVVEIESIDEAAPTPEPTMFDSPPAGASVRPVVVEAEDAAADQSPPRFIPLPMPELEAVEEPVDQAQTVDPASAFARRFGPDMLRVQQTESPTDDAQLAELMIDAASETGVDRAVAMFMLEKAFEFASKHPVGYRHLVTAGKRLARMDASRKLDLTRAVVELSEKWYGSEQPGAPTADDMVERYLDLANAHIDQVQGDQAEKALRAAGELTALCEDPPIREIADRREEAALQIRLQKRIDRLAEKLQTTADDQQTLRQLVSVYVYELDRPARAMKYAERLADQAFTRSVAMAARPLRRLSQKELLDLAGWYADRGADPKNPNRPAMCIRARLYYEQYLATHLNQDDQRLAALKRKNAVDEQLDELGVGMKLARRKLKRLREAYGEVVVRPDVRAALDKAIAWLYEQQHEAGHWEENDPPNEKHHRFGGQSALVAYALMMADENPRTNAQLRKGLGWVFSQNLHGSYAACFRVHLWETLPENMRQRRVAQGDIGRTQSKIHMPDGSVGYHLDRQPQNPGDLSTTLAGYLTLWLGETNGMFISHQGWGRICGRLVEQQSPSGMWSYRPDRDPTASMTAAGLTILLMALDQNHLQDHAALREKVLASVDLGLYWMDTHYDPTAGMRWKNYYLAAVQHVGLLSGRRDFNGSNWYDTTADHLIASQQSDGSWGNDIVETAFAVAFLGRGGNYYDASVGTDTTGP